MDGSEVAAFGIISGESFEAFLVGGVGAGEALDFDAVPGGIVGAGAVGKVADVDGVLFVSGFVVVEKEQVDFGQQVACVAGAWRVVGSDEPACFDVFGELFEDLDGGLPVLVADVDVGHLPECFVGKRASVAVFVELSVGDEGIVVVVKVFFEKFCAGKQDVVGEVCV